MGSHLHIDVGSIFVVGGLYGEENSSSPFLFVSLLVYTGFKERERESLRAEIYSFIMN